MSDGLEDVVAAHTVMSDVDGAAGRLIIRGRSLDDLAGRATFEEVAFFEGDGSWAASAEVVNVKVCRGLDGWKRASRV